MPRSAARLSPLDRAWPLVLALVLSASACASPRGPSPAQILVRNSTGAEIGYVWLQEVADEDASTVRMGMISPLPRGATQKVDRPPSAAPLPAEIELLWLPKGGLERSSRLSLASLADDPRAASGALLIDLLPNGTVRVSIEEKAGR
jgi:hypothetical protein